MTKGGKTLKRDGGDLAVEGGRLVFIEGVEAVRQELKTTLETIAGEDVIDENHGFDAVTAGGASLPIIEREIRVALERDERVERVDEVEIGDADRNRRREISVTVELEDDVIDMTTQVRL